MHTEEEKEAASVTKELGPGNQSLVESKMSVSLGLKGFPSSHLCSFSLTFSLAWLRVMIAKGALALQALMFIMRHSSAPEQWLPSADWLGDSLLRDRSIHFSRAPSKFPTEQCFKGDRGSEVLISQLSFCLLASVASSLLSKGAAPQLFWTSFEGAADAPTHLMKNSNPPKKLYSLSPGKSKAVWSHLEEIHRTLQSIVKSDLIFHNDPGLVSGQKFKLWLSEIIPSLYLWVTKGLEEKDSQYQPIMLIIILGAPFNECKAFKTSVI